MRRLCRKNADALRLAIQLSKCETAKEAATKANAAHHAKELNRLVSMLSAMRCGSDSDSVDDSTSGSDNDDAAPSHAEAYTKEGHNRVDDPMRKGPTRK
ncbi:hypothetical protein D1007_24759 [Hordeum vulgare]|nr:hypothetical protein D1007_24759 [Hordeum vulgare]